MSAQTETLLRREVVEIGRRVYDRFMVAANDGNISARLNTHTVLITPTGVSKGFMSPQDLIKIRLDRQNPEPAQAQSSPPPSGRKLVTEADVQTVPAGGRLTIPPGALVTPLARQIALDRHVTLEEARASTPGTGRRPSTETPMHLAIYCARPDVMAVVHTHAPAATAFALTDVRLDEPVLPEVLIGIGPVAVVPYARTGTTDLPQAMRPYLAEHDAFLLANHGAVTVGRSLEEAYFQMERLELFARIRLAAQDLGAARLLPPEEIAQLEALREQLRKMK